MLDIRIDLETPHLLETSSKIEGKPAIYEYLDESPRVLGTPKKYSDREFLTSLSKDTKINQAKLELVGDPKAIIHQDVYDEMEALLGALIENNAINDDFDKKELIMNLMDMHLKDKSTTNAYYHSIMRLSTVIDKDELTTLVSKYEPLIARLFALEIGRYINKIQSKDSTQFSDAELKEKIKPAVKTLLDSYAKQKAKEAYLDPFSLKSLRNFK